MFGIITDVINGFYKHIIAGISNLNRQERTRASVNKESSGTGIIRRNISSCVQVITTAVEIHWPHVVIVIQSEQMSVLNAIM